MAEAQLLQFLDKVRQLNAFVALSEADPRLRQELSACEHHDQVVALARRCGFEIGRRWGELPPGSTAPEDGAGAAAAPPGDGCDPLVPDPGDPAVLASVLRSRVEPPRPLLGGPCPPSGEERSEVLLQATQWRLERIHSCAHSSPAEFWYDQQEEEWVTVLQGTAGLRFADEATERRLQVGDCVRIRAGRRHRVTETDPAPGTIWLALFWRTV